MFYLTRLVSSLVLFGKRNEPPLCCQAIWREWRRAALSFPPLSARLRRFVLCSLGRKPMTFGCCWGNPTFFASLTFACSAHLRLLKSSQDKAARCCAVSTGFCPLPRASPFTSPKTRCRAWRLARVGLWKNSVLSATATPDEIRHVGFFSMTAHVFLTPVIRNLFALADATIDNYLASRPNSSYADRLWLFCSAPFLMYTRKSANRPGAMLIFTA